MPTPLGPSSTTVHDDAMPGTQVRSDRRQRPHQRALQREQLERRPARGPVDADTRLGRDPCAHLLVQVDEVAERAQRQEVDLDVLDAGLDG